MTMLTTVHFSAQLYLLSLNISSDSIQFPNSKVFLLCDFYIFSTVSSSTWLRFNFWDISNVGSHQHVPKMKERESGHNPMLVQSFCWQMLSVRNNAGGRGGLSQGRLEVEVGLVVVCPCLTSCLVLRTLSSGASSAPRETCRSSSCRPVSGQTQRTWSWNHKYYMYYIIITNKVYYWWRNTF